MSIDPLNIDNINFNTSVRSDYVDKCQRIINDTNRESRLKDQLCVVCYESDKIGGCAITRKPCDACQTPVTYSSTYTDMLCHLCAKNHKLCKHCGGDIQLKRRRYPRVARSSSSSSSTSNATPKKVSMIKPGNIFLLPKKEH